jgi:hypothetical protein
VHLLHWIFQSDDRFRRCHLFSLLIYFNLEYLFNFNLIHIAVSPPLSCLPDIFALFHCLCFHLLLFFLLHLLLSFRSIFIGSFIIQCCFVIFHNFQSFIRLLFLFLWHDFRFLLFIWCRCGILFVLNWIEISNFRC